MEFVAYGHAGIEGTHTNMLIITQKPGVIPRGDCVVGTRAAYEAEAIAGLAQIAKKLKITLKTKVYTETIIGDANNKYAPGQELIIRKDNNITPGTFMINADKAAADLNKKFIETLKNPEEHLTIIIDRVD